MVEDKETAARAPIPRADMPPVHVTVHVHLEEREQTLRRIADQRDWHGGGDAGRRDGERGGLRPRPVLTGVLAAVAVVLVGSLGYRMGNHGGEAAVPRSLTAVRSDPVAPIGGAPKRQVPVEIEKRLAEPPRVTPPPGTSGAPAAKSGPAAFGLSE